MPNPDLRCPSCSRLNDIASGMNATVPDPGSLSICWRCHCISIFEADASGDLWLRLPTPEELVPIMADPDVRQALQLVGSSRTPHEAVERFR